LQRAEGLPTPEESGLSKFVSITNDSSSSFSDLENELSSVKEEIRSLRSDLNDRDAAIVSLRWDHDEAVKRYDKAILNLQMSEREKNSLRDQVQRLRTELSQEREMRAGLEADIETRVKKEARLLDMLAKRAETEEGMIIESRERARTIEPQMSTRGRRERRTKASTIINIHARPESRVSFPRFLSRG
jgi:chromosome segregation ATPase